MVQNNFVKFYYESLAKASSTCEMNGECWQNKYLNFVLIMLLRKIPNVLGFDFDGFDTFLHISY